MRALISSLLILALLLPLPQAGFAADNGTIVANEYGLDDWREALDFYIEGAGGGADTAFPADGMAVELAKAFVELSNSDFNRLVADLLERYKSNKKERPAIATLLERISQYLQPTLRAKKTDHFWFDLVDGGLLGAAVVVVFRWARALGSVGRLAKMARPLATGTALSTVLRGSNSIFWRTLFRKHPMLMGVGTGAALSAVTGELRRMQKEKVDPKPLLALTQGLLILDLARKVNRLHKKVMAAGKMQIAQIQQAKDVLTQYKQDYVFFLKHAPYFKGNIRQKGESNTISLVPVGYDLRAIQAHLNRMLAGQLIELEAEAFKASKTGSQNEN